MAQAPVLHREVRLTPTAASPSHILHVDTSGSSRTSLLRAGSKRPFDEISGLDEETYTRKHLATEASVFFRAENSSPRSFLWRVLDDRKVLEIQSVDLVQKRTHEHADSWLTFQIGFKEAILKGGVAFADSVEHDALECFALTEGRELVTITLRRDLLTRPSVPSEFDPSTCVKKYTSSFLSVRSPYRFTAISSTALLISLADGGLVKLERKAGESGAQWRETFFSEGGWRGTLTLKGLNPFAGRPTVRYGELELDPSAIADMAQSPDGKYVWTVSLDHYLRAWSTATGKVAHKQDLLDQDRRDDGRGTYFLSAEQGTLLQIVSPPRSGSSHEMARGDEGERYSVIVHSPRDHQLKIYDVADMTSIEGEGVATQDVHPGSRLIPPVDDLMNTNIWHLEEFYVRPGANWADTQIWIRARTGALCNIFTITISLLDERGVAYNIEDIWQAGWSTVDGGLLTAEALRHSIDYPGELEMSAADAVTPSEKWLAFLFHPGRFTCATLETALYVYSKARGLAGHAAGGRGLRTVETPLEERLTAAISSKVLLRRLPSEQPDYERYQRDIQAQWQTFYAIVSDLHTKRNESLALAFDATEGLPWGLCADFMAPVRVLRSTEKRCANLHLLGGRAFEQIDEQLYNGIFGDITGDRMSDSDERPGAVTYLSRLLAAARQLRGVLSPTMLAKLDAEAERDALAAERENVANGQAEAFFERLQMADEISQDDLDTLTAAVAPLGGLGALSTDDFSSVLAWVDEVEGSAGHDLRKRVARYGVKFTVSAAHDMLIQARGVLLDMLTLTVFMGGDFDPDDLEDFSADEVYHNILYRLRKNSLMLWLASNTRETAVKSMELFQSADEAVVGQTVTLLEDVFIGDWESTGFEAEMMVDMPELLTFWTQQWLAGPALDEASWNGVTTHILARLVKAKETDLAIEFLKFTDRDSAWSIYVQGRLQLDLGNYARAAADFKEAAVEKDHDSGMSAINVEHYDTANLLLPHENGFFGVGLATYYQHVTALFEKLKAYSYVADFAALALEHTENLRDYTRMMAAIDKRKQPDSPALDRLDATQEENRLLRIKETRDELINRLFSARMMTGRFSEAYQALKDIRDQPLKRSGLKKLLDTCIKQDAVTELLALPFETDLLQEADKALLDLAKKDLSNATSSATTTPYYQILYAFRTQRSDFRGAAEILFEHLERLRRLPSHHHAHDPEDETLLEAYVLLINTLCCCGEEDAWLLAEPAPGADGEGRKKRRLVTLADIRREYTVELDRRSDVLQGRFPVVGGGGGEEIDVL